MSLGKIIVLILIVLYAVVPYDLFPDFIPVAGWFDDAFLVGLLIYYLKKGCLPGIFAKRTGAASHAAEGAGFSDTHGGEDDGQTRYSRAAEQEKTKDPYEILGLKHGAAQEEIHAAYRQAVHQYHPDKVSHLGPELRELAQEKFIEIQEAYDNLRRRGEPH